MGDSVVDAAQWVRFAKACADNGQALLADARLLLEHCRYARALALGVLAREEMGKGIHAMSVVTDGVSAESSKQFGKLDRNHGEKLQAGALLHWLAVPTDALSAVPVEELLRVPKAKNDAKKRAFYVDLSDGEIQSPTSVSEVQAREVVDEASRLADFFLPIMSAVDPDLHADALATLGPCFAEVMTRDVEENASTPEDQMHRVRSIVELTMNGRLAEELRSAMKSATDSEGQS